jgi:hypothetical protein
MSKYCQNESSLKQHSRYLANSLRCAAVCFLTLFTLAQAKASSVYVALDSYEYDLILGDIALGLNPLGLALGGSFDVSDKLFLQYEFGKWNDDGGIDNSKDATSDFDSSLTTFGLGIKLAEWELLASFTDINDEATLQHGRELEFNTAGEVGLQSIKLLASRTDKAGQWERYYSFGLQYDDAESMTVFGDSNQMLLQDSDALFGMLKVGGDYYWPLKDKSAWFLGASLSWYQELSSSNDIRQFNLSDRSSLLLAPPLGANGNGLGNGGGNGNGGASINRTFGDNFGLIGIFATYHLNDKWSLDWGTSLGFAGDGNSSSHALTLGCRF